jgi:predicted O-methyltransferase YrrM
MIEKDKFMEIFSNIVPPDLGGYLEGNAGGSSIRKIEGQTLYKICSVFQPKRIVETGTHSGCSTNYLLKYAVENRATVHSFDVVSNAGADIIKDLRSALVLNKPKRKLWRSNVSDNGITMVRNLVLETAQKGIDLFFHDSDHKYENVKWEFDNITCFMEKGSPVILHDVLNDTANHETHLLFKEVVCSWKHIFDTPSGLGLIVL